MTTERKVDALGSVSGASGPARNRRVRDVRVLVHVALDDGLALSSLGWAVEFSARRQRAAHCLEVGLVVVSKSHAAARWPSLVSRNRRFTSEPGQWSTLTRGKCAAQLGLELNLLVG